MATLAGLSRYRASQGVKLQRAHSDGAVSDDDFHAVVTGRKHIREVLPALPKAGRTRPASGSASGIAGKKPVREDANGDADGDAEAADVVGFAEYADEAPDVTVEEVSRRWERFKSAFAVADLPELRRTLSKIIAEEQRTFDR